MAEVRLVLDHRERVFPAEGPPPPRTGSDPLQFLLRAGYDLRLRRQGADLRLQLARHGQRPFVEWHLGYSAFARCDEPSQQGAGPSVPVPLAPRELLPRLERNELVPALKVVDELQRSGR